jgi:hypothetical protein
MAGLESQQTPSRRQLSPCNGHGGEGGGGGEGGFTTDLVYVSSTWLFYALASPHSNVVEVRLRNY